MARPSARSVGLLVAREVRDSWRNRWFVSFTFAFTLLALGLSWLSVSGVARTGYVGLGRTAGSLVNLVLLIVPLMGLSLGAQGLATERERGSLLYLLAQPVDPLEVLLGKFLGLSAAILGALSVGFAVAALAMSGRSTGGGVAAYLGFAGLGALLACATVSVGLLISVLSSRGSSAVGFALLVWLGFVFAGDLGLMGSVLMLDLDVRTLLALALANPLEDFKIASVLLLQGGLESMGPAGVFAARSLGKAVLPLLAGLLVAWTLVPLVVSAWFLNRRGGIA